MNSEPVPFFRCRGSVRSLLKKGTGTSPGALLGGVIGHELGASPLFHVVAEVRSLLKKGTGTSPGALLGGVIGHELGASPLFQQACGSRRSLPDLGRPSVVAGVFKVDALRDDGGLPKTGDLPVREAGFFENPLGVLIVCGGIGEASFHRG